MPEQNTETILATDVLTRIDIMTQELAELRVVLYMMIELMIVFSTGLSSEAAHSVVENVLSDMRSL
jgi:hypothetical protein